MDEDKRGLKDSGKRQEFASGAVRDLQEGKGRYDLMPMYATYKVITEWESFGRVVEPARALKRAMILTIEAMSNPASSGTLALEAAKAMLDYMECIYRKTAQETNRVLDLPTHGLFRVARVYEKGAIKYAPRNWEKGINLSRYLDSSFRHEFQTADGKNDEDHPAQACWNLLSFAETKHWIDGGYLPSTLNDLPVRSQKASAKPDNMGQEMTRLCGHSTTSICGCEMGIALSKVLPEGAKSVSETIIKVNPVETAPVGKSRNLTKSEFDQAIYDLSGTAP